MVAFVLSLVGSSSSGHRCIPFGLDTESRLRGILGRAVSTVLNMAWNASWLKHGGSPPGMGAGPGLWQSLGPFFVWSFAAATVLSLFGKGKARVLMLGWSISMLAVLQFD